MTAGLAVRGLGVTYHTDAGPVRAVDDLSLDVAPGERLGLVGESGSGKTTAMLALMRMLRPPGRCEAGTAAVDGVDLLALPASAMRAQRMRTISYVPQGAMNALNPVLTVHRQMQAAATDHGAPEAASETSAAAALAGVGLEAQVLRRYPHELSGGMKQRVCIALATLLRPKVVIADEPTSALDVVTQRQVMETLGRQQDQSGAALILIGHDMGLMAQFVDRVAVMYAGRLVEVSSVRDMFTAPKHPYAQALINSLPSLENKGVFQGIPGLAPSLLRVPSGCPFHPRCKQVMETCKTNVPALTRLENQRDVACHLYTERVTA